MKKLDLNKIAIPGVPTKQITKNICGIEQTFEIKPIYGRALYSISKFLNKAKEDELDFDVIINALIIGLQLDKETVESLVDADIKTATEIATEIFNFTKEFNESMKKEQDFAKSQLDDKKKSRKQI